MGYCGYLIQTSWLGLKDKEVFVAHERGGWGPKNPNSDFKNHQLEIMDYPDSKGLILLPAFLEPGEEFKLVVPDISAETANGIYAERLAAKVHRGLRFDYDNDNQTFWLLSDHFDVIRLNEWNQNNVFNSN